MAVDVIKKIYRPAMTVGQVYAKPYGSAAAPMPVGNVLELGLEHTEDVQRQDDMTQLGGGTHAEVRRVTEVKVNMKIADLNVVNLARASLGTVAAIEAGEVEDEPFVATGLGILLPLLHIDPTAVVVKKGATAGAATPVAMAGNYLVKSEGIVLLDGAPGITVADKLWVSYSYGAYAAIEALTTKTPELQLLFGGLNEADSGKPVVVDIWRASQGITKTLALINKGFGALDVEGTVLQDPTKTGAGVSKYYRTRLA
ncbi:hypothetical protein [Acidovorax sp. SUPP2825]|uniref:phage tail tube protein n=1 Tax=Acidovorax sp. SUPP2825 TaxID=2920879 RepID=UPI0023DE687D|nr:hypothetical protein [Acidovorax sp. SUPP2825]GKS97032.1 hypothetical protein AVAK2825_20875 [Acidovorax sp. SUPP2825]